MTAWTILAI